MNVRDAHETALDEGFRRNSVWVSQNFRFAELKTLNIMAFLKIDRNVTSVLGT